MESQNVKRVKNLHYNVAFESYPDKEPIETYSESTDEWDQWLR